MRIAFTAYKQCGKSTATKYLVDNYDFRELAFATPLKKIVASLFHLQDDCYKNSTKERKLQEYNVSPRKLLQVIGTDLFRNTLPVLLPEMKLQYNNIWINYLVKEIDQLHNTTNIVVSDVRFDDEYYALKQKGFVIYKLERYRKYENDLHESENGTKYDFVLCNNRNKEDLYRTLDRLMTSHLY